MAKYRIIECSSNRDSLKSLAKPFYSIQKHGNGGWFPIKTYNILKEAEEYMEQLKPEYEKVIREYEI